MNILIRLPNWLGDMVMSTAFVRAVQEVYPEACIDLITKKGLDSLLEHFPAYHKHYIFSKEDYPGLAGAWRFGKMIRKEKQYDLFFCLPDSLSSALMAFATGSLKRVGYRKEGRGLMLTNGYSKQKGLHRVEEYLDLLKKFLKQDIPATRVGITGVGKNKQDFLVVNINSEAVSRRLPVEKSISLINHLQKNFPGQIFLVGGPRDQLHVEAVYAGINDKSGIINMAGSTPIPELIGFLEAARLVISTDSGPAHLANALGTHCIVLFGAGNEKNTAPYLAERCTVIRYGQLNCEPCTRNTCRLYGIPKCMNLLDESRIGTTMTELLKKYPC